MDLSSTQQLLAAIGISATAVGCLPSRGTMPTETWRPETPSAHCSPASLTDTHSRAWSQAGRAALEAGLEAGEPVVVSAIGCQLDVLPRCRAPGQYQKTREGFTLDSVTHAMDLEGSCADATHVVSFAGDELDAEGAEMGSDSIVPTFVELEPLSLDDVELSGTWSGTMYQPHGPFDAYAMHLRIVADHGRVSGVTHLETLDNEFWGDLRFEGRLVGNTLYFDDAELVDDNLNIFLDWCIKGGYMLVDPRKGSMHGAWTAPLCAPGTMDLRREGRVPSRSQ